MWDIQVKLNSGTQSWSTLGSYEDRKSALNEAFQVSTSYYLVKVTAPDGSVIWSN